MRCTGLPLDGGGGRASRVPDASLPTCHALGPRQSLGDLASGDPSVLASEYVKTVADCVVSTNGAESLWGGTSPRRPAGFPVYASTPSFGGSAPACHTGGTERYFSKAATLGTGGWLGLTRSGLAHPPLSRRRGGTRQEAPSCARRTNVADDRRERLQSEERAAQFSPSVSIRLVRSHFPWKAATNSAGVIPA